MTGSKEWYFLLRAGHGDTGGVVYSPGGAGEELHRPVRLDAPPL